MPTKVTVISTPKNRVLIRSQDTKEVRTVGVSPSQPAVEQIVSAFDTANAAYEQANTGTGAGKTLAMTMVFGG